MTDVVPRKNVIYEWAKFNNRVQQPSESDLTLAKAITMARQSEEIKRQQNDVKLALTKQLWIWSTSEKPSRTSSKTVQVPKVSADKTRD